MLERGARSDDVDHRVGGADLVEVDLLEGLSVYPSLHAGERLNGRQRPRADAGGKR